MLDNVSPIWRVVPLTKIWFQITTQNFQRTWFSNTICTNQSKHFSWFWSRKSMNLKLIVSISMSDLTFESWRQVDNVDSFERTFLDTLSTSNTQNFRNESNFRSFVDFNTFLSCLYNWAVTMTLKRALLRLTFLSINNCNSWFLLRFGITDRSLCLFISFLLSLIFLLYFDLIC